jgi:hypothetical protein
VDGAGVQSGLASESYQSFQSIRKTLLPTPLPPDPATTGSHSPALLRRGIGPRAETALVILRRTAGLSQSSRAANYLLAFVRQQYPSLHLVPPNRLFLYAVGCERNERLVEVQRLQDRLQTLGALSPKARLPEELVSEKLHEALDAYAD